ncbi:GNAT family N-acetyltransferase [Lysinibacillus telephonicus]|nr:GNAT family protein [Lysinibacillus telephonicus]
MLQNNKIQLKIIEKEDLDLIQKWNNNFNITQYTTLTSFFPRNRDEELSWYERKYKDNSARIFMIVIKENDTKIGFISFSNLDYRNQKAMLSIVIGEEEYQGKGYASDSLKILEDYLKHEINIRKISVQILGFNKPSIGLFKKNGYLEEGILKSEVYRFGKYQDLLILSKFL